MLSTTKRLLAMPLLALWLLLCASVLVLAPVATAAEAPPAINYEKEKLAVFQGQLAAGQIQAVTINRRLRSLRTTLKDGRHVLAHYKPAEGRRIRTALTAKHVTVRFLTVTQAVAEAKTKHGHHKLRYIVGGVVIVVIVIVAGALLYRRRRLAYEE